MADTRSPKIGEIWMDTKLRERIVIRAFLPYGNGGGMVRFATYPPVYASADFATLAVFLRRYWKRNN